MLEVSQVKKGKHRDRAFLIVFAYVITHDRLRFDSVFPFFFVLYQVRGYLVMVASTTVSPGEHCWTAVPSHEYLAHEKHRGCHESQSLRRGCCCNRFCCCSVYRGHVLLYVRSFAFGSSERM